MGFRYFVRPGVLIENMDNNPLVVVPGKAEIVSLAGRPAEGLLDVEAVKAQYSCWIVRFYSKRPSGHFHTNE